jgi:hypothetical protein
MSKIMQATKEQIPGSVYKFEFFSVYNISTNPQLFFEKVIDFCSDNGNIDHIGGFFWWHNLSGYYSEKVVDSSAVPKPVKNGSRLDHQPLEGERFNIQGDFNKLKSSRLGPSIASVIVEEVNSILFLLKLDAEEALDWFGGLTRRGDYSETPFELGRALSFAARIEGFWRHIRSSLSIGAGRIEKPTTTKPAPAEEFKRPRRNQPEQKLEQDLYLWLIASGIDVERQTSTANKHRLDLWIPGVLMMELKAGKVTGDDICQAIDYWSAYERPLLMVGSGLTNAASRGLAGFNKSVGGAPIVFVTWGGAKPYLASVLKIGRGFA